MAEDAKKDQFVDHFLDNRGNIWVFQGLSGNGGHNFGIYDGEDSVKLPKKVLEESKKIKENFRKKRRANIYDSIPNPNSSVPLNDTPPNSSVTFNDRPVTIDKNYTKFTNITNNNFTSVDHGLKNLNVPGDANATDTAAVATLGGVAGFAVIAGLCIRAVKKTHNMLQLFFGKSNCKQMPPKKKNAQQKVKSVDDLLYNPQEYKQLDEQFVTYLNKRRNNIDKTSVFKTLSKAIDKEFEQIIDRVQNKQTLVTENEFKSRNNGSNPVFFYVNHHVYNLLDVLKDHEIEFKDHNIKVENKLKKSGKSIIKRKLVKFNEKPNWTDRIETLKNEVKTLHKTLDTIQNEHVTELKEHTEKLERAEKECQQKIDVRVDELKNTLKKGCDELLQKKDDEIKGIKGQVDELQKKIEKGCDDLKKNCQKDINKLNKKHTDEMNSKIEELSKVKLELDEAKKVITSQNKELSNAKNKLSKATTNNESMNKNLERLNKKLQMQNKRVEEEKFKLQGEHKTKLDALNKQTREEIRALTKTLEQKRNANTDLQNKIRKLQQENDRIKSSLTTTPSDRSTPAPTTRDPPVTTSANGVNLLSFFM